MMGKRPWLLAFDLSGPSGLLVLEGEGRLLARSFDAGKGSASLFSAAREMMDDAGAALREIGVVGVARGPGAFTGVRTAVMAAKTLCEVLSVDLVAPESLAVVAAGRGGPGHVFVAADARRGQVYYSLYAFEEGAAGWVPVALEGPSVAFPGEAAASLQGWRERLGEDIVLTGTGIEAYPDAWPQGLSLVPALGPRPEGLAVLCRELHARGEVMDHLRLLPLYLRQPDVGRRGGQGEP